MENVLTVLLVEDDQMVCKEIIEYADTQEDISLIGVTNNASRALECIYDQRPDAIILDLELHMGSGNGLFVLQEMNLLDIPKRPYVLVTTNNSSTVTYQSARKLGADFIMSKHQADYEPKQSIDFLCMMKPAIQAKSDVSSGAKEDEPSPERHQKRMASRISQELDQVGISPKAVGYQYLVTGILLTIEAPITNLCSAIGQKYGKTDSSVQRAMQNAIDKAWRVSNIEDLLQHYTAKISADKGVPTINEFVYHYANKLRNKY